MSSFALCDVCGGTCSGACPHSTDLNRAISIFPEHGVGVPGEQEELHEFHFFGHDATVPWAPFHDPRYGGPVQRPPEGFQLFELSHEAAGRSSGRGLTFEVCLNNDAAEQAPNASPASGNSSAMAASSATIMSFSGSTMTDASSGRNKEGCSSNHPLADQSAGQLSETAMEREIKVRRYKEKRNKRRYEKQTRYASRKAYAEMRPRIKGRFAKAHEADQETSQSASVPPSYDQDRSIDLRWFNS